MRSPLKPMFFCALSTGQGSTICVTLLVATASPPCSEMVSRRSRYSEQPPSAASTRPSASARPDLLNGRIGTPPWHIDHVPGERLLLGDGDLRGRRRQSPGFGAADLGL